MTEEKDRQSETTGYSVQSKRPRILYDAGGSAPSTNLGFNSMQSGGKQQFVMKIPNDKVPYLVGKWGQTIKNIQTKSRARIQIGPMHLPRGDTSTEKSVYINGLTEQIEAAKELVNEVICGIASETNNYLQLGSFPPGTNSYMQQQGLSYPLSGTWALPGQPPAQQQKPHYGYTQPGGCGTPPRDVNALQAYAGGSAPSTTLGFDSMQSGGKQQKIGPLHLPCGDASTEKSVCTKGGTKQIEPTNELLKEIINGKRFVDVFGLDSYVMQLSYPPGTDSYMQQQQLSYPPSGTWAPPGQPPVQQRQLHYGYRQPGAYGTPSAPASYYGNYPAQVGDWNPSNQVCEKVKGLEKRVQELEVTIKNLIEAQAGC